MQKQFRSLKKGPRIVVATPGRLNDHLRRRSLKLDTTEILVLDEGDRMLDMGFQPQLDDILDHLPGERQTHLFTATLPTKVKRLAEDYLQDPIRLDVGRVSQPVEKIKQSIIQVNNKEKDDKLVDELNKREGSVIVFFRTKARTDEVADYLEDYGFKVGVIHGDRSQGQRNRAIQQFKSERTRILCATDVAARGIDIPSVGHVINYDLPRMEEDYVHRIGRTARNGAEGEAVSFVARQDHSAWMRLAKRYKIQGVDLENASTGGGRDGGNRRRSGGGRDGERRERPKRYAKAGDSGSRNRRDDGGSRRRTGGTDGPSGRWSKPSGSRDDRREGGERSERRASDRPDRRDNSRSNDRPNRREGGERSERRASDRPVRRDDRRSNDRPDRREAGERSERRASDRPDRRDDRRSNDRSDRRESVGADSRGNFPKRSKSREDSKAGGARKRSTFKASSKSSGPSFGGGRSQGGDSRRPTLSGEDRRSSERMER